MKEYFQLQLGERAYFLMIEMFLNGLQERVKKGEVSDSHLTRTVINVVTNPVIIREYENLEEVKLVDRIQMEKNITSDGK